MAIHHALRAAANSTSSSSGGSTGGSTVTNIPVTTDLRIHWDFGRATIADYDGDGTIAFTDDIPGDGLDANNGGACKYWNRQNNSTVDIINDTSLGVNYAEIYYATSNYNYGKVLSTEHGALTHNMTGNLRSGFTYVNAFKRAQAWNGWCSPIHWDFLNNDTTKNPETTSYRYTGYLHLNDDYPNTPYIRLRDQNGVYVGGPTFIHDQFNDSFGTNVFHIFACTQMEDPDDSNQTKIIVKYYKFSDSSIVTSTFTASEDVLDENTDAAADRRVGFIGDNMYWNGGPEWHWYEHAYYDKAKTETEMEQIMTYMANKFS